MSDTHENSKHEQDEASMPEIGELGDLDKFSSMRIYKGNKAK